MKTETAPLPVWFCTSFPSPAGLFSLAIDETGALAATAFGGEAELAARCPRQVGLKPSAEQTLAARAEIDAYWEDPQHAFSLPLREQGTPFQRRIWDALRRIPAGETRSYGGLAAELHTHPRAVGQANARNPFCLVVPCHRLIGGNGALAGGAFGPAIKRRLLEHEGALVGSLRLA